MKFQFSLLEKFERDNPEFPFYIYTPHFNSSYRVLTPHWHENLEIWYCQCAGKCTLDGHRFSFHQGDIIVINKKVIHSFEIECPEKMVIFLFDYQFLDFARSDDCERKFLQPLKMEKYQLSSRIPVGHVLHEELRNILEELIVLDKKKPFAYELGIKVKLYQILYVFYSNQEYGLCTDVDRKQKRQIQSIQKSIEYMEEHFAEDITIEALAKESNLSKFYFIRLFKELTSMTPMEFLTNQRLEYAEQLLYNEEKMITDISYHVGFNSVGYFTKKFKKKYKISPTEYRKKMVEDERDSS